jgi:hypothetical protein
VLSWPCCVRLVACGSLNAGMCTVCAVYSPGDGCTFRDQRQTELSCAADMVPAAQQDTVWLLGVMLIFGVSHIIPFSVYRRIEGGEL